MLSSLVYEPAAARILSEVDRDHHWLSLHEPIHYPYEPFLKTVFLA